MAYQIAFDLYESATQQFLGRVLQAMCATAPIPGNIDKLARVSAARTSETTSATAESTSSSANKEEEKPSRKLENLVSSKFLSFS